MAWYLNHYHCDDCGTTWTDEWSCCCDDECRNCGSKDWSPHDSDDLSTVVQNEGVDFVVLHSPPHVEEDRPRYEVVARLSSAILANVVAEAMRGASAAAD